MKLVCVGSGSKGNTYLLTDETETLVLDCGMRFLEVKKALHFKVKGIKGALVTHDHGDHLAYAHDYITAGIPVWRPYMTESMRQDAGFGNFRCQSFGVVHNVPCCGYLIEHKAFGKLLYVTDTEYIKYTFRGLNVMLIEANYDNRYIDDSQAKYRHVLTGHMSIQTTLDCIKANRSESLNHVILCHLSENNANASEFLDMTKEVVPAGCTVDIAVPGMEVELGEIPF